MFGAYTKASSCHWSDLHVPGILLFCLLLFLHVQPALVPLVVKLAPIHSILQFTLHSNALFFGLVCYNKFCAICNSFEFYV